MCIGCELSQQLSSCFSQAVLARAGSHPALPLAPTAAPRELHFVDELPHLGIGKLDRRLLRERYADGTGGGAYGW